MWIEAFPQCLTAKSMWQNWINSNIWIRVNTAITHPTARTLGLIFAFTSSGFGCLVWGNKLLGYVLALKVYDLKHQNYVDRFMGWGVLWFKITLL